MANVFRRKSSRNIGATPQVVGGYTVPAATDAVVIGLILANISSTTITGTVTITGSGGNITNIVRNAVIPVGGSLVVAGGEQKIVLETGDTVNVTSNTAASIDVTMSILEIT